MHYDPKKKVLVGEMTVMTPEEEAEFSKFVRERPSQEFLDSVARSRRRYGLNFGIEELRKRGLKRD